MSKRDTKNILIETAIDLIWQRSYFSVSVDDICKKSDVKKGSFYYHFESKSDLAVAAMDQYFTANLPVINDIFSADKKPTQRFKDLCHLIIEKQKEYRDIYGHVCGCPFASLGSELAGQEDKIMSKTEEIMSRYKKFYEASIRDLVDDGLIKKDTNIKSLSAEAYNYILGQVTAAKITNDLSGLEEHLEDGLFKILEVRS